MNEVNHMEQVAEMLGIELGERFKILYNGRSFPYIFALTPDGLCRFRSDETLLNANEDLGHLITGDFKVVKLHRKVAAITEEELILFFKTKEKIEKALNAYISDCYNNSIAFGGHIRTWDYNQEHKVFMVDIDIWDNDGTHDFMTEKISFSELDKHFRMGEN